MSKYDLSILIPALREEFLRETVADIVKNKRGNTEVIVGLDGEWANPGIEDHPDVRIVYSSKNLGQRGMTNYICRLSEAKYVAKCDAHCAFDEGFDVKLMDALKGHDDWTIVPVMKNLHVFNWKCRDCGDETYQGVVPEGCKKCDVNTSDRFDKVLVWRAKPSPNSSAYKFTPNRLQFKYFNNLKAEQHKAGEKIAESMSLQGSFFMLTREKYWELNICDENWGGWGQQGSEVALKTWLSGGRVVCNLETWYAHMFRTQDGFAFPWNARQDISQAKQQQQARQACMDLFFHNKWEKQVRPLSWLIERFWKQLQAEPDKPDDPKWTEEDLKKLKETESRFKTVPTTEKGIIFYTDNQLTLKIAHKVQKQLKSIGLPIVSSSLKPMAFGDKNVVVNEPRGYLAYFKQIVSALEASTAKYVFFCEHDVLYHPSHFDFTPPSDDKFYYNQNVWRLKYPEDFAVTWEANQVAELCCSRELALDYYKKRLEEYQNDPENFDRRFEPGGRDLEKYGTWRSAEPNVDIRHGDNLTKSKWSINDFRDKSTCINWQEGRCPEWAKGLIPVEIGSE